MKTFLLTLRATALVDAIDHDGARFAWQEGEERDVEVDTEGGIESVEIYDEAPEATRPLNQRYANAMALDMIAVLMHRQEWSPDTLDEIAEIVRATGREIGDSGTLESEPPPVSAEIPHELLICGERLRTQGNRATANPIFQVRGDRRIYGMDPAYGGDNFEWIDVVNDFTVEDPPEDEDNPPEGIEKLYYTTVTDILTTAFTVADCEEHLRRNRHNYSRYERVYIYADSIWRCPEMLAIRSFLLSLPPPPPESHD